MNRDEQEDTTVYNVVVNHEEQYSIWPADRQPPLGWREVGKSGLKQECLDYIKEVWTDMRPLSLRKHMEEVAKHQASSRTESVDERQTLSSSASGDDLVDRLCQGDHPVEVTLRAEKTGQALRESIERGYVHIKFTDTQGGTELGVRLNKELIELGRADFEKQTGMMHLVGGLTLNYVDVQCIADIDLHTLQGQGRLERVGSVQESFPK